ncbi:MAG: OmpH family outer membrane protein [Acidobacteriota bacterium]|nr:MAG: OmpH family outer membrane protein [Acidobacteriota bacterium]
MSFIKIARFSAAVAVLTVASICVSAQQDSEASRTVAFPDSRLAMIYSDSFLDPKTGIARFNSLLGILNREFQPRQAEMQALQTRIFTLTKEIEDTQSVADPSTIRAKRDQLAQMSTELKRKGEDAEAAYNKRRTEIFTPLQQDIGKALEAFAKANGITVIVDGSQVPMVYAADSIDITRTFINYFNGMNPATASVTHP